MTPFYLNEEYDRVCVLISIQKLALIEWIQILNYFIFNSDTVRSRVLFRFISSNQIMSE